MGNRGVRNCLMKVVLEMFTAFRLERMKSKGSSLRSLIGVKGGVNNDDGTFGDYRFRDIEGRGICDLIFDVDIYNHNV